MIWGFWNEWNLLDDARRGLLRFEEGQEGEGEVDEAGEVDADLLVEGSEVDFVGLGEIVGCLDAGVEEDTVNVRVAARDLVDELAQILGVTDVVCEATGLVTMLADEAVDSVLAAADGNDLGTLTDELLSHAGANTGGGSDQKDTLVGKGHGAFLLEDSMQFVEHEWW